MRKQESKEQSCTPSSILTEISTLLDYTMRGFFSVGAVLVAIDHLAGELSQTARLLAGPVWNFIDVSAMVCALNEIKEKYNHRASTESSCLALSKDILGVLPQLTVIASCIYMAIATTNAITEPDNETAQYNSGMSFSLAMFASAVEPIAKLLQNLVNCKALDKNTALKTAEWVSAGIGSLLNVLYPKNNTPAVLSFLSLSAVLKWPVGKMSSAASKTCSAVTSAASSAWACLFHNSDNSDSKNIPLIKNQSVLK